MAIVAGVDTSTQSCKVLIVDSKTGTVLREGRAEHPEGTKVNPLAWVEAFERAAREAGGIDEVEAWSIGGQQHGLVLLDRYGEVIRDAPLWNDTDSAQSAFDLTEDLAKLHQQEYKDSRSTRKGSVDPDDLYQLGNHFWVGSTGSTLVASITVTKLRWVAESEPKNAEQIAAICLPHDYLTWRLAGFGPRSQNLNPDLKQLVTDRSDASGTGYFDAKLRKGLGDYRRELIELALAPLGAETAKSLAKTVILPKVVGYNQRAQTTNAFQSVGKPIGPGGGDNAMAALGLGLRPGDVSISLGTSGVVSTISERAVSDFSGAYNCFADATGHYLPIAVTLNASQIVDAARKLLGVDYDRISDLALQAPAGADELTLIPYFEGERVPNRPQANATLFGLTQANFTAPNLARAFIEGMLLSLNDCLTKGQTLGLKPDRIFMIGGSMKSPAVQKIAPQIFCSKILVPQIQEYVALGAAKQAAWILDPSAPAKPPTWPLALAATLRKQPLSPAINQYNFVKNFPTLGEASLRYF